MFLTKRYRNALKRLNVWMIRQVAAFAVFLCLVCGAPSIEDIPPEYRDFFPKEIREFFNGLSDAEKAIIKDVSKNYASYKNEEESLAALKKKSPELGAKAEKLHSTVKGHIEAMGGEAKAFAKEVIAGARKIHAQVIIGEKPSPAEIKENLQSVIDKYNALSDAAKEDLEKQCPHFVSVFENVKSKMMAETQATSN
ncbi:nematode fatty acid retinoid binding protein [Ancylostoma caninum]|uniref:Fatty-acid and retinol-binding protein 1 n=1 Tax=Ancylostoma caninum TaxID=29170 RepID=A0A368FY94_ANCCA|nr:nematode fatty acid retinoid binding protein [Ancylostoma caninum]